MTGMVRHAITADDRHVVLATSDYEQENPLAYVREVLAGHDYEPVGEWAEIDPDPHLGFPHRRFAGAARSTRGPAPTGDEITNWFTYHPPTGEQIDHYRTLRDAGRDLARLVEELCPPSRERSTALAKVREAVMWANAAIACNPTGDE